MADGTALLLDRLPPDDHSTETAYASAESGDVIGADPTNTSPHDGATSEAGPEPAKREALGLWRRASFVWSPILLTFALVITYYDIANGTTTAFGYNRSGVTPVPIIVVNTILFSVLLCWVAALEGSQVALVALFRCPPSAMDAASARVKRAITAAHRDQNLERFIIGRQFLLVFLVFVVSKISSHEPSTGPLNPFGWKWPPEADVVLIQNNLLLMLVIAQAQLIGQLVAARDPVHFLELVVQPYPICIAPSLLLETTGIMHCAYVLKDWFVWVSGVEVDPRTVMRKTGLYYARAAFSVLLVLFCAVVVSQGVVQSKTHASVGAGWDALPGWGAYILFLFFLVVIGGCEGLQISAVKLKVAPSEESNASVASRGLTLLHGHPTPKLQHFLVGRQLFAAVCYVLLARCTSFSGNNGEIKGGFYGWHRGASAVLLQSGLLGSILVTNVGVLAWRVAASCFPKAFMNNWPAYGLLRAVLGTEATGVIASAWVLSGGLEWVTRPRR